MIENIHNTVVLHIMFNSMAVSWNPEDRISNTSLPEHVIHPIFPFLETIDVIRASALFLPYMKGKLAPYFFHIWKGKIQRFCQLGDFVNWMLELSSQNGSIFMYWFRRCFIVGLWAISKLYFKLFPTCGFDNVVLCVSWFWDSWHFFRQHEEFGSK